MTIAASAMPATAVALPTGTQLPASAGGLVGPGQTLNEGDFLQLLTAQLEHQDPLDPTSPDALATELAQFSTASGVQTLATSINGQQAVGLVGQNVAIGGNSVILGRNGSGTGAFNLTSAASDVAVVITDSTGGTVASLNLGAMPAGTQAFSWNGTGGNGAALPPGAYNFSVVAVGANGAAVAATPYTVAPVIGVGLGGSTGPMLDLGGGLAPVPLSAVQQVL
jgi:flagellar basal-body rod modification protein FlgD